MAAISVRGERTKGTQRDSAEPLSDLEVTRINAYWRAANYLSVGQIYLLDNPLLTRPLSLADVKPRLLGHWGTTPGLNFIYAHMNRVIKRDDIDAIFITGPGHGGPGLVANTYLEGTYSEVYPKITRDAAGLKKLFKQFSFPGGIPTDRASRSELDLSMSAAHARETVDTIDDDRVSTASYARRRRCRYPGAR
jgi:phosphoketolase